jgi:hypothetical protein
MSTPSVHVISISPKRMVDLATGNAEEKPGDGSDETRPRRGQTGRGQVVTWLTTGATR